MKLFGNRINIIHPMEFSMSDSGIVICLDTEVPGETKQEVGGSTTFSPPVTVC